MQSKTVSKVTPLMLTMLSRNEPIATYLIKHCDIRTLDGVRAWFGNVHPFLLVCFVPPSPCLLCGIALHRLLSHWASALHSARSLRLIRLPCMCRRCGLDSRMEKTLPSGR